MDSSPSLDRFGTHTERPIRIYKCDASPAASLFFGASTIIITTAVVFGLFIGWGPMHIGMLGVLQLLSAGIWLKLSFSEVRQLNLYRDRLEFVHLLRRSELRYNKIERLHMNRDSGKLRIESKRGNFHAVKVKRSEINSVMRRLESAVYGHSI